MSTSTSISAGFSTSRHELPKWVSEADLFSAALARVKRRVDPKQYQLFQLFSLEKWSLIKIYRFFHANPMAVYFAKLRVTRLIHKEADFLRYKGRQEENEKNQALKNDRTS